MSTSTAHRAAEVPLGAETATGVGPRLQSALTFFGIGTANLALSWLLFFIIGLPLFIFTTVSFALIPALGIGLVMLWVVLALGRLIMDAERGRSRAVYGLRIPPLERRVYTEHASWWARTFGQYFNSEYWRSFGHLLLKYFLGMVGFSLVLSFLGVGIGSLFVHSEAIGYRFFGLWVAPPGTGRLVGVLLVILGGALLWAFIQLDRALDMAMLDRSADELRTEVADLTSANVAAERAASAERSRIERDLHDGAQPRLVNLAMTLGMAKAKMDSDPEAARRMLDEAHSEAKSAVTDLRQIARGFHPAILDDRGLDAALSALAARSTVPVRLSVDLPERVDRATESVAYFVVAEALTNVAKHSSASRADVVVARQGPVIRVTVVDDGNGGAHVDAGPDHTGLAGLEQRVRAARGTFNLVSPQGGPTILTVELPCA